MKAKTLLTLVAVLAVGASVAPAQPPELQKVVAELEKDVKAIEAKHRKEVLERREKAIKEFQGLHDGYVKAGKKDEAEAVAGLIAVVKEENAILALGADVLPDPGTLGGFRDKVGESFYIRVTGNTDGQVWGSGVYTDDSTLATAAVHAGLVKSGQSRVLKVTVLAGQASYDGSTENGVTTEGYGDWEGSFKIEAVKAEKK